MDIDIKFRGQIWNVTSSSYGFTIRRYNLDKNRNKKTNKKGKFLFDGRYVSYVSTIEQVIKTLLNLSLRKSQIKELSEIKKHIKDFNKYIKKELG